MQICFGVKFIDGTGSQSQRQEMNGHAWLVWRGKPVLEPAHTDIPNYTVTFSFPDGDTNLQTASAPSEH